MYIVHINNKIKQNIHAQGMQIMITVVNTKIKNYVLKLFIPYKHKSIRTKKDAVL